MTDITIIIELAQRCLKYDHYNPQNEVEVRRLNVDLKALSSLEYTLYKAACKVLDGSPYRFVSDNQESADRFTALAKELGATITAQETSDLPDYLKGINIGRPMRHLLMTPKENSPQHAEEDGL